MRRASARWLPSRSASRASVARRASRRARDGVPGHVGILGFVLVLVHWQLASGTDSAVGQALAFTGVTGLVALVVWAILPRWRSVVPGPLRGLVVAARDAPGIRSVRTLFGGYERWRMLHRTTGLFVTAGFVHGVMQSTAFDGSAALRWTPLAIGGVGVAFYVMTSAQVLAATDGELRDLSVFMCGPSGMLRTFQHDLRKAGVPARRIHREYFDWR